jgi:hypothetical protein
VVELLADGGALAALAAAGPAQAARFTWERCAAATVAAFREVAPAR